MNNLDRALQPVQMGVPLTDYERTLEFADHLEAVYAERESSHWTTHHRSMARLLAAAMLAAEKCMMNTYDESGAAKAILSIQRLRTQIGLHVPRRIYDEAETRARHADAKAGLQNTGYVPGSLI